MKLGKILLVLIVVLFTLPAMAQTGVTVTGRIVERGNNLPVEPAAICCM